MVLEIEPRALCILSTHFKTETHIRPSEKNFVQYVTYEVLATKMKSFFMAILWSPMRSFISHFIFLNNMSLLFLYMILVSHQLVNIRDEEFGQQ